MKKKIKYFIAIILVVALSVGYFLKKPDSASASANIGLEKVNTYEVGTNHYEDYKVYLEVTDTTTVNHIISTLTLTNMTVESFGSISPWNVLSTTNNDTTFTFDIITNTYQTGKNYIAEFTIKKINYEEECHLNLSARFSNEIVNRFRITKNAVDDTGTKITQVNEGETFNYKILVEGLNNYTESDEVIVIDTIPDVFEIISSDATTTNGQTLTWNLGVFEKGNTQKELNVKVKAKVDGTFKNTATLTVGTKKLESTATIDVVSPNLTITKTVSKSEVSLNETFKYTITIKNTGTGSSNKASVYDKIPDNINITNISYIRNNKTTAVDIPSDNILNIDFGSITKNEIITITIDAIITDVSSLGKTIKNTAVLKETGKNDKESDVDITTLKPDLSITKESSASKVNLNEEFIYTITVKNNGKGNAVNVIVTDIIPNNLAIINVDGGSFSNQTITSKYDTIKPNEEKKITIKVKAVSAKDTETITNTATITSDNDTPKNDTVDVTVTKPNLEVTKVASTQKIKRGESFTYTIILTNTGTGVAKNIVLKDIINENFTITSVTNATYKDNIITKELDTLNPSESIKIEILVTAKANATLEVINNEVTVTSSNNDTVKDDKDVEIVDSNLKLSKTLIGKEKVLPNEEVEYLITIKNIGNAKSNKVLVEDTIPTNLEYISATSDNFTITHENNKISLVIDSIDINEVITINVKTKVKENVANNTIIKNVVIATEDGKDPIKDDVDVTVFTPKISITKVTDKDIIKRGNTFTYTITIKNESLIDLENLIFTDIIDNNFIVLSLNDKTYTSNRVTINYDLLKVNEEKIITIKVKVKDTSILGVINNTATIKVNDEDFSDSKDVEIVDTNLEIKKEIHNILNGNTFASHPEDYIKSSGETFSYFITVKNNGTTSAESIKVIDNIPDYLEFESASVTIGENKLNYEFNNNTFTLIIDNINTTDYVNIIIKVKVKKDIVINEPIKNIVTLQEDGKEDKTDGVDITVKKPNLSIIKTVSKDIVKRGENFTYTINVKNNGEGKALNVNVIDVIDNNFEIISVEGATIYNNVISAKYDIIEPNESKTITINVKAKENSVLDTINNKAIVSSDNDDNKESDVDVTITDSKLSIEKYISKNNIKDNNIIKPGESFKYYIIVKNTGSSKSNNTSIYDKIPDEITVTNITAIRNDTNFDTEINNNILSINLGEIDKDEVIVLIIDAKLNESAIIGKTINNIVTLKEDDKEDKTDEADLIVSDSDIYMIKSVDKKEYQINDTVTYTIKIFNSGNSIANNLYFTDTLDERFTYLESSSTKGSIMFDTNKISLDIPSIEVNEVITITLKVKVNNLAKENDIIGNNATLKTEDKTLESNVDIKIIDSNLVITKTSNKNILSNNDELIYIINVKNIGKGIAKNIKVIDVLDNRLKLLLAANSIVEDNVITWNIDTLKSNEEVTFTILIKINDDKEVDKINNKVTLKEGDKPDKEDNVDIDIINKKEEVKEENPSTGNFLNSILVITLFIVSIIIFIISNKNKVFRKI